MVVTILSKSYQHVDFSDLGQACVFRTKFLKGKWLKIDIDQIVWITDAVQLKQLYVIAGGVVLQVHDMYMYTHIVTYMCTHIHTSAPTYTYTYRKSKKRLILKLLSKKLSRITYTANITRVILQLTLN